MAGTPADTSATTALVERVDTALVGAAVMLAVALVLVVTLIAARQPAIGSWRPDARGIAESPATAAVVGARA